MTRLTSHPDRRSGPEPTPAKPGASAPDRAHVRPAHPHGAHHPNPIGRGGGFTLLEVLIALAIFAIGVISLAAIFPTAILQQRLTVDDVMAQQVARSAAAIMQAKPIDYNHADLLDSPNTVLHTIDNLGTHWAAGDRRYPQNPAAQVRYVWEPAAVCTKSIPSSKDDWKVLIYVMRTTVEPTNTSILSRANGSGTGITLPANHGVRVGDQVADDLGYRFNVIAVNGNQITLSGPASGGILYGPSALRVVAVTGAVK